MGRPRDLDLEHGKVTIHRSIDRDEQNGSTKSVKDNDPRSFGLEAHPCPSMITSKPANDDHFKTGQRGGETGFIYAVASAIGKFDV